MAPPDTRTLEDIIPADYQQRGQVPFQYDKSSDNNIFYSKKVQEIKKKMDMLLLQRFYVSMFSSMKLLYLLVCEGSQW